MRRENTSYFAKADGKELYCQQKGSKWCCHSEEASSPIRDHLIPIETVVIIIVVIVAALTIERIITRYVSQAAKLLKWAPYTMNNIVLIFRIFVLIGTLAVISNIAGLPPEWVLSLSAIGGAALGFASQKTLGNVIAGLFLLAAHPFKVGDYVRIGQVEGIVQELTINYTKILTSANSTISISNLQILDRDITNFLYQEEENGRKRFILLYF